MQWVKVKFDNYWQEYSYLCDHEVVGTAEVGNKCLVVANGEIKLVTVCKAYKHNPPDIATKHIIMVLDSKYLKDLNKSLMRGSR